jgi:hypothetical protein
MKFRTHALWLISFVIFGVLSTGLNSAEGASSTQVLKFCVNKSSGAVRKANTCRSYESAIQLTSGTSSAGGSVQAVTIRYDIANKTRLVQQAVDLDFPKCPQSAPIVIGNAAYIPATSPYSLSRIFPSVGSGYQEQEILDDSGAVKGRIYMYGAGSNDSSWVSRLTFLGEEYPNRGNLQVFLTTSCAITGNASVIER